MNFDEAFQRLIGHEGGYTWHPDDPGGETNWGITKRDFPGEDIKNLTLARAKAIYQNQYWGPAGCDAVPDALKYPLFDFAVNSGVPRAVRTLQKVVGELSDGVLGPRTLQAIGRFSSERLAARFFGARLEFMANQPNWGVFGKGWARRVATELQAL